MPGRETAEFIQVGFQIAVEPHPHLRCQVARQRGGGARAASQPEDRVKILLMPASEFQGQRGLAGAGGRLQHGHARRVRQQRAERFQLGVASLKRWLPRGNEGRLPRQGRKAHQPSLDGAECGQTILAQIEKILAPQQIGKLRVAAE